MEDNLIIHQIKIIARRKKTYQKTKVSIVAIDSKDRDIIYIRSNKYRIYFKEKFENVKKGH